MAKQFRDISRYKRNVLVEYREVQALERELKMLLRKVKQVNAMLKALKKTGHYKESIAVENLMDYLDTNTIKITPSSKSGLISTKGIRTSVKLKNVTTLTAINKALDNFISNKTSTPEGMENLYRQRREELYKYLDPVFVDSLSDKEMKDLYSVYQSNEYDRLQSRMESSEFFVMYTQAINEGWNKNKFFSEINKYLDTGEDLDLKESVSDIYDKYINEFVGK